RSPVTITNCCNARVAPTVAATAISVNNTTVRVMARAKNCNAATAVRPATTANAANCVVAAATADTNGVAMAVVVATTDAVNARIDAAAAVMADAINVRTASVADWAAATTATNRVDRNVVAAATAFIVDRITVNVDT